PSRVTFLLILKNPVSSTFVIAGHHVYPLWIHWAKFMLHPPMASFCPGVTNILNLTFSSELGFHEPSLFLISFSYLEPPPISICESNGLSAFIYQTTPPGLVGYKNEAPSSPRLLPTLTVLLA